MSDYLDSRDEFDILFLSEETDGREGRTQDPEAARPRQRQEEEAQDAVHHGRAPERPEEAQEALRYARTLVAAFHPKDQAFLDDEDNWPDLDDIERIGHSVVREGFAFGDPGGVEGAIGSTRNAY